MNAAANSANSASANSLSLGGRKRNVGGSRKSRKSRKSRNVGGSRKSRRNHMGGKRKERKSRRNVGGKRKERKERKSRRSRN
jgi:hypothetical protein